MSDLLFHTAISWGKFSVDELFTIMDEQSAENWAREFSKTITSALLDTPQDPYAFHSLASVRLQLLLSIAVATKKANAGHSTHVPQWILEPREVFDFNDLQNYCQILRDIGAINLRVRASVAGIDPEIEEAKEFEVKFILNDYGLLNDIVRKVAKDTLSKSDILALFKYSMECLTNARSVIANIHWYLNTAYLPKTTLF